MKCALFRGYFDNIWKIYYIFEFYYFVKNYGKVPIKVVHKEGSDEAAGREDGCKDICPPATYLSWFY